MDRKIVLLISLFVFTKAFSASDIIFRADFEEFIALNDTGLTWGSDYLTGINADCSSNINAPQDCHDGRDVDNNDNSDGRVGFSFSKIANDGTVLPASATSWSCIKDNVTKLMWEAKTTDNTIHNSYTQYQWGGITRQGSNYGTYYNDWDVLVNGSNSETLCGKSNWRAPTTVELMSLLDLGVSAPKIEVNYFPNIDGIFWSSQPANWTNERAMTVSFAQTNGVVTGVSLRTSPKRLMLVTQ